MSSGGFFGGVSEGLSKGKEAKDKKKKSKSDNPKVSSDNKAGESAAKLAAKSIADTESSYRTKRSGDTKKGVSKDRS